MALNKSEIAKREEEILKFWQDNKIFEKSVSKSAPKGDFVFYDGPPFATGLPHYGHALASIIKDLIPRYKTMQGFRVERKWGWDCHGLPIENLVEKELGFNSKRDIEQYGIEKFNAAARASVLRYADEWEKLIPRIGRWVDMKNDYRTMDPTYTESVWWSFNELFNKNRIYQSFKVMQYCPRCGTPLSNFEVNQGYKDITDISVYAKFELVNEPGTFVLAWTTTPWTLPGNVALAINPEIQYVKVKSDSGNYILAKERLASTFKDQKYEIVGEVKSAELIGQSYKPLFNYYQNISLKDESGNAGAEKRGWKIYAADFVTTEEGTGIVHMAPAFGDEDFQLAKKEGLPFVQHIDAGGHFKPEVKDFAGQLAKPKDDHQKADVEIIKYLAHHDSLFAKEKIVHPYPHCWRCETPLLNYATSSWFLRVTEFKDKLVRANQKINWVPKAIGQNRFGDWLEGARDWAISRSRYWGAPIPVWKCNKCEKPEVLGSVADIKTKTKRNNYFLMRHGEGENNTLNVLTPNDDAGHSYHLTPRGKQQVLESAQKLKRAGIDLIIYSPLARTTETAKLVGQVIGENIEMIVDERILEENVGDLAGMSYDGYKEFVAKNFDLYKPLPHGESFVDLRRRLGKFIFDIDQKYYGRTILIVTHDASAKTLKLITQGINTEDLTKNWIHYFEATPNSYFLANGHFIPFDFAQIPHNENYELDFHRPFIDKVSWKCDCGGEFKRVLDVFDVWYESGSMPYGKLHYPFNPDSVKKSFLSKPKPKIFPANFIAEGLDQTRGWFYSLLVLNYELFGESPYNSVIVNGLILAEDGRKMAKSLQNYPDLEPTIDKFSADALRYYLISSPAVRAEEVAFSEKGLDEVTKKLINRLLNVVSFYELYKSTNLTIYRKSENILDQWILARINQLNNEITINLEKYELDRASRPILDFIDDLSTWYLRRSRERFKSDDEADKSAALSTTRFILQELSKLMAPFMPFLAEDIYQRMKRESTQESVHLENWPAASNAAGQSELLKEMAEVRRIVSLGLEARAKEGIKVRQPLGKLKIKNALSKELLKLIEDEINVKNVIIVPNLSGEVELDIELTPELKEEGQVRELMRAIQDLRKEAGLEIREKTALAVSTSAAGKSLIEKFQNEISRVAALSSINFEENDGQEIKIDEISLWLKLKK